MNRFTAKRHQLDRRIIQLSASGIAVEELSRRIWKGFVFADASLQRILIEQVQIRCEVLTGAHQLVFLCGKYQRSGCATARPGRIVSKSKVKRLPQIGGALGAALLLASCASILTGNTSPDSRDWAELPRYQAERPPLLSNVYQAPGKAVYRYCRGSECPGPTPKILLAAAFDQHIDLTDVAPGIGARAVPVRPPEKDESGTTNAALGQTSQASVFFRFNSTHTDSDAATVIKSLLPRISTHTRISLIGRTDSTGSLAVNRSIAQRRANSVAVDLEQAGVSKDQLQIDIDPMTDQRLDERGFAPGLPTSESARRRRVDIRLSNLKSLQNIERPSKDAKPAPK